MPEFTQDEKSDYFFSDGNGSAAPSDQQAIFDNDEIRPGYEALFDVPDFSTLVKGSRSATARDYEIRVKSMLKTGAIGALRHDRLSDAAAIFEYGPAFSAAAGTLAEKSEKTRQMIDILTAPENPYFALAIVAIPFAAQLFRNHQPVIQQVTATRRQMRALKKAYREDPETFAKKYPQLVNHFATGPEKKNVEVKLPFGRKLSFRVALKFNPLRAFTFAYHTQTHDPDELVSRVFSDPKLIAALKKQRINIVQTPL